MRLAIGSQTWSSIVYMIDLRVRSGRSQTCSDGVQPVGPRKPGQAIPMLTTILFSAALLPSGSSGRRMRRALFGLGKFAVVQSDDRFSDVPTISQTGHELETFGRGACRSVSTARRIIEASITLPKCRQQRPVTARFAPAEIRGRFGDPKPRHGG